MKLRLIVFLTASTAATMLVQAQTPTAPPQTQAKALPQARAKRLAALKGKVAKALGLSPAQRQQDKTIREQAKLTIKPVREQLQQNRQALAAAVKTGDAKQIQTLSQTRGQLMGQALAIRSQAQAQVYAGLTNDQRTKLDAIQTRVQAKLAERRAARSLVN